jgi:hypothetical protein
MKPRTARALRLVLLGAVLLPIAGVAFVSHQVGGLGNLLGMLRYDQREEGTLKEGDVAPDIVLLGLDGTTRSSLLADRGGKPVVLVFGSFT